MERFWPGPLTVILPKKPVVPDIVTAGLATVGVGMPRPPHRARSDKGIGSADCRAQRQPFRLYERDDCPPCGAPVPRGPAPRPGRRTGEFRHRIDCRLYNGGRQGALAQARLGKHGRAGRLRRRGRREKTGRRRLRVARRASVPLRTPHAPSRYRRPRRDRRRELGVSRLPETERPACGAPREGAFQRAT